MFLARVIGNIWATKKYQTLTGISLLIIQPVTSDNTNCGAPIIAADTMGAGRGETVIYITASEAVIPLMVDHAPVDASIVGIVDHTNNVID
ncbi:MAG: EutN/CcmL family microcompartment protein [Ignavibacteriaceae bacterium]|nr:EutN/CcmL family microcompartment protein [Ignavibacteriaceae bacterium]